MDEFIPADQLKKTFEIFGHFYTIVLNSGEKIDCRSVLEIVSKNNKPSNADLLLSESPDAIFIMMNPGSSKPLEDACNSISEDLISQLKVSLVPTKPDTTQYQVMRVMLHSCWNHVRVLNISDLRDPKSGKFIERFNEIEKRTGFESHSLFADERDLELKRKLNKKPHTPIICAWGVNSGLEALIQRCLGKVSSLSGLTGLLKPNTTNKYFHPLPTLQNDKVTWVSNIVAHLRDTSSSDDSNRND